MIQFPTIWFLFSKTVSMSGSEFILIEIGGLCKNLVPHRSELSLNQIKLNKGLVWWIEKLMWKGKEGSHLTDESTELARGQTIINTGEDGNGDYDVAEEASEVVEGVHPDWRSRVQRLTYELQQHDDWYESVGEFCVIWSYYTARVLYLWDFSELVAEPEVSNWSSCAPLYQIWKHREQCFIQTALTT